MSHPYQCNVRLSEAINRYELCALSPATQSVYSAGAKAFMSFVTLQHLPKPVFGLPVSNQNLLRYFVVHC